MIPTKIIIILLILCVSGIVFCIYKIRQDIKGKSLEQRKKESQMESNFINGVIYSLFGLVALGAIYCFINGLWLHH